MTRRTAAFLLIAAVALAASPALAGRAHVDHHRHHLDRVDFEFEDDGTLVLDPHGYRGESLTVSEDLVLSVNGREIDLDSRGRKLVAAYYARSVELAAAAEEIGREGARIGARGAALAVKAIAKVARLLDDDYDADDLEREVEKESEKIEFDSGELEKQADRLEELVEEMDEIAEKMSEHIPAVGELEWFD